jgi:hypothetical protein
MGCDIHMHTEKRVNGQWVEAPRVIPKSNEGRNDDPLENRSYSYFGWLADVRNYSKIPPISQPRGVPDDMAPKTKAAFESWDSDAHSASWLTVDEILAVDFDQMIENRRVTINGNGGCTAEPGHGKRETLREFLGEYAVNALFKLRDEGVERIVFWFDN